MRTPQVSLAGRGRDWYFRWSTSPKTRPKSMRPLSRYSNTYSALPLEIW